MQDPLVTLYSLIKTSWALTGDLASDKVQFSTGWFDEGFKGPQVTITEVSDVNDPIDLGYVTVRVTATHQVDVWVPVLRSTGKGPGLAKKHKWQMREEVKRILKANLTGLTGLKYVILNQTGRSLDELDRNPPILRYVLPVSTVYDIT